MGLSWYDSNNTTGMTGMTIIGKTTEQKVFGIKFNFRKIKINLIVTI